MSFVCVEEPLCSSGSLARCIAVCQNGADRILYVSERVFAHTFQI